MADGNSYEGELKHNMLDGKGTFKWKDGRTYQGMWS